MQLPEFLGNTKLTNTSSGIFDKGNFVYYLHNGSLIHCHYKNYINSYRYITFRDFNKIPILENPKYPVWCDIKPAVPGFTHQNID